MGVGDCGGIKDFVSSRALGVSSEGMESEGGQGSRGSQRHSREGRKRDHTYGQGGVRNQGTQPAEGFKFL